jgi:hypothetical protein
MCAIHCMDLPIQKEKRVILVYVFSGMLIDWFQNEGFIYHSKWRYGKNP